MGIEPGLWWLVFKLVGLLLSISVLVLLVSAIYFGIRSWVRRFLIWLSVHNIYHIKRYKNRSPAQAEVVFQLKKHFSENDFPMKCRFIAPKDRSEIYDGNVVMKYKESIWIENSAGKKISQSFLGDKFSIWKVFSLKEFNVYGNYDSSFWVSTHTVDVESVKHISDMLYLFKISRSFKLK